MTAYFVDRDLGPGVGEALRSVGVDALNHVERFAPMERDEVWIAAVCAELRVILTRDRHIRTRPPQREVFEAAGGRCFVVATGASTPLGDLRALLIAWPRIERHCELTPAPFMYGIGRDGALTQYIPITGPNSPSSRARATITRRKARHGARRKG